MTADTHHDPGADVTAGATRAADGPGLPDPAVAVRRGPLARVGVAAGRLENLQVVVREETPFLPKVAFALITVASMGGAAFTGTGWGLDVPALALRWLAMWTTALAGGFLVWRVCYVRDHERDVAGPHVDGLLAAALDRAARVARRLAPLVAVAAVGPLLSSYLSWPVRAALAGGALVLAVLLAAGVRRRGLATAAAAVAVILALGWGLADAGTGFDGLVRVLHLEAFLLWLGGALWNIGVAMPAGRLYPHVDAVVAGAHQLDRFRWVVRFALPTIIVTGLYMADAYRGLGLDWWVSFPGVLIPLKALTIVALVVVFITCPLFRQCSPVQGVCNVDDLEERPGTGARR